MRQACFIGNKQHFSGLRTNLNIMPSGELLYGLCHPSFILQPGTELGTKPHTSVADMIYLSPVVRLEPLCVKY